MTADTHIIQSGRMENSGAVRILTFMEATSINGPAKNLVEFARYAKGNTSASQRIYLYIATYARIQHPPLNDFITGVRDAGIHVDVIRERHAFDFSVIPQIRAIVASVQPDAIQTYNVKSHFLIWLMRLHHRYPWLAEHHGYTSIDWKDRLYRHFNRISLPAAHRVVAVCRAFVSELQKIGVRPERVTVRHNMVRPFIPSSEQDVQELRGRLGLRCEELVLLSAGRLSREKGHVDLVSSIARVRKYGHAPPFRVLVAGEGPERTHLLAHSRELGVQDLISFIGYQSDLRPYYTMADILILPSHSEGSPNVLLEAMAAKIAVVATTVGGIPEIVVDKQSALLVPPHDPGALATAVLTLLINPNLRTELAAHARLRSEVYSREAYGENVLNTWSKLLHRSLHEECR